MTRPDTTSAVGQAATTTRRSDDLLTITDLIGGYKSAGTVLNGVSLRVTPGELVSVLGPNGAGKTSTLRAIYQQIRIDSGTITLHGENALRLAPHEIGRRGVAHVPEGRGLFPHMSVAEHLTLGGLLTPSAHARAARRELVLELFPKLGDRLKQMVSTMSGGEQQMVAIGAALMSSPSLLILDEPSLGLAPNLVDDIFARIGALRDAEPDLAVVLVEQRVVEALEVADWAYVLSAGQVVLEGPSSQMHSDSRIQTAFLGDADPSTA